MNVCVIIPAYNAESTISETVLAVKNSIKVESILVVDDGSKDRTSQKALESGARVLVHKKNRGKGAALNTAAREVFEDIIILLDADLGKSAKDLRKLLTPIQKGEADVTVAKFPPSPVSGGFGLVKGLAKNGIYSATGSSISSPLSGQRAMTKQVFLSILPFAQGYGVEVAATIKILKNNWRLMEVAVEMEHNFSQRNIKGFIHRGQQFYDILKVLLREGAGKY